VGVWVCAQTREKNDDESNGRRTRVEGYNKEDD